MGGFAAAPLLLDDAEELRRAIAAGHGGAVGSGGYPPAPMPPPIVPAGNAPPGAGPGYAPAPMPARAVGPVPPNAVISPGGMAERPTFAPAPMPGTASAPEIAPPIGTAPASPPAGMFPPAPLPTPPPTAREAFVQEHGQRPTYTQFQPAPMRWWQKILAPIAVGAASWHNPEGGARAYDEIYNEPRREAQERYQSATGEYDRGLAAAIGTENEERQRELESSAAEERGVRLEGERLSNQEKERALAAPLTASVPTLDQQLDAAIQKGDRGEIDRLMDLRDRKAGAGKSDRTLGNPFEAYAYGTPVQKQAATEFLDLEEKAKTRAQRPSEWEERYQLFKRDPDAYLQMTGAAQRGTTAERQHAEKMLKYFDEERTAISKDFLLDEPTRKQRLAEIGELEKPYLELAKPGNAGAGGASEKPAGERRGAAAGRGRPGANGNAATLPPDAASKLKEGVNTTFRNGQVWTLQRGKPVQVQPEQAQ